MQPPDRPRFQCSPETDPPGGSSAPPVEPPDASEASAAAATMARKKAEAERERKTAAPVTRGDLAAIEAGLRQELRAELAAARAEPAAVEPKKAGGIGGTVAGVVVVLVMLAGLAAVVIFKPFVPKGV